jgi:hypothetical protein
MTMWSRYVSISCLVNIDEHCVHWFTLNTHLDLNLVDIIEFLLFDFTYLILIVIHTYIASIAIPYEP